MMKKEENAINIMRKACFADDMFPLLWNKNKLTAVRSMEIKIGRIMKWLKDSGMLVNESKTDLCLFHRGDTTPITIKLNGKNIKSNKSINVLGIIFDAKMQWSDHIAHAIKRSNKALNAIKLIQKNTKRSSLDL